MDHVEEYYMITGRHDEYKLQEKEAALKRAKELEEQKSKKIGCEFADEILAYLQHEDEEKQTTKRLKSEEGGAIDASLARIGSKLETLLPNDRFIIVPFVSRDSLPTEELKGLDKQFSHAIDAATGGKWTILSVSVSRVDTIEGNPNIKTYADYEGDANIDSIYECNDKAYLDEKLLDKLHIDWGQREDGYPGVGMVSCYRGCGFNLWENGDVEKVGCYDCEGDRECPHEEDSDYEGYIDGEGHTPRYEETHYESFLIGISKELVQSLTLNVDQRCSACRGKRAEEHL